MNMVASIQIPPYFSNKNKRRTSEKKSFGMKDYFFAFLLPNLELEHTHIYFHQLGEHAYIRQANAYEQILPKL